MGLEEETLLEFLSVQSRKTPLEQDPDSEKEKGLWLSLYPWELSF